ncbi:MAG: APC family permease [Kineosporiaceae bacterium]
MADRMTSATPGRPSGDGDPPGALGDERHRLARNRIGVAGIVFFVVAAAAPLVGMTGAVPVAIGLGNGAGAPGAYLVVGIVLLVFSVGYAAMSHHVTNTGAFFAYVGRGLGLTTGVGSAFVSLLAYVTIQLAVFGFFGGVVGAQAAAQLGLDLPWYVWVLVAWLLVLGLSLLKVDVGARLLGVLLTLELLALLLVGIAVVVRGGGPGGLDLAASFSPEAVFAGGFAGSAGIALAFAFASFIGFEATAIYGEESRDPKRTVPLATYISVGLITVLFALVSFAMVSALGADRAVDEVFARSGDLLQDPAAVLFSVAEEYVGGWLADVMAWLVVTSLFAGLLAFQNSAARYVFSMARAGVLPGPLSRVNGRGAPGAASVAVSVVTGVVVLWFLIRGLDPVANLFFWMSALAVLSIVLVEVLVSVAVIAFFRRHPARDARAWSTVVAPGLAILGMAAGAYLLAAKFALLAGTAAEGSDPVTEDFALNATGWSLVLLPFVVFVVGLAVGRLRRRAEHEEALADLVS